MKRKLLLVGAVALLVAIVIAAQKSHLRPPPVVGNIYCNNAADCNAATRRFTAAVQQRFPIGSKQNLLEIELLKQGFHHLPESLAKCRGWNESVPIGVETIDCPSWDRNWNPRHHLSYDFTGPMIVCGRNVAVVWSSDQAGNITHVEGYYNITCL
jgi:hypothetical protein